MSEPLPAHARRKYSRFRLAVAVDVRGQGLAIACACDDVGARGCRLVLSPAPPVGSELEVRVRSERTSRTASGTARVAWVAEGQLGLSFARPLVQEMVPFLRDLLGADEPLETPQGA